MATLGIAGCVAALIFEYAAKVKILMDKTWELILAPITF